MNKSLLLSTLKSLTSVSQQDFQQLYQQLVDKTINAIPWEEVIRCLKKRRAYLLPPNADSDTIYRQQDAWTYAVFIASLWHHHPKLNSINDIEGIVSASAWQWLQQYDAIKNELNAYYQGEVSLLCELIAPLAQTAKVPSSPSEAPPKNNNQQQNFFEWLQQRMNRNDADFVYHIDCGYVIEMPKAGRQYQDDTGLAVTLEAPIEQYCIGDWQKRNTLTGILIKPEQLPALKNEWSINPELQLDPLAELSI